MNIAIENLQTFSHETQAKTAELIAQYTSGNTGEALQMLPVSTKDVFAKYACYVAHNVSGEDPEFAGFIGALEPEAYMDKQLSEVGTLYVPKDFRKLGIATRLVVAITSDLEEKGITPFAFANPGSLPIFEASGYSLAMPDQLPSSVFLPCQSCPKLPINGGCCDVQLIKTGAVV